MTATTPRARRKTSARRATLLLVPAVLLVVLGALALATLGRRSAPARPVVLAVSADTAGWITPCGCTFNQSGGLPRRGAYLASLRQHADVLYLDAGGAPHGTTPYHRLKFQAIAIGEVALGIEGHNIGGPELALGPDALRQVAAQARLPLVSANTADAADRPLGSPIRMIRRGSLKIALTGIVSPAFATPETRVAPPREALLAALRTVEHQYDLLIVLAYLPDSEFDAFAASLPEADVIIGGVHGQTIRPHHLGPSIIAASAHQGKFMVELPLPSPPGTAAPGKLVEMNLSWPDDPAQLQNHKAFLRDLAARDFPATQTGVAANSALLLAHPGYSLAGDAQCRRCHTADDLKCSQRGHARAWQALTKTSSQADPDCQRCHTTGYALPGGFSTIAASADRINVGCETCHGPSSAHAVNPTIRTPYQAKDICVSCHDPENSPKFNYLAYWELIHHGQKLTTWPATTRSTEVQP